VPFAVIEPDEVLVLTALDTTVPLAVTEPAPCLVLIPLADALALAVTDPSPYRIQVLAEFHIGSSNETSICSSVPN
jgi:hypothetical protein